jgi:hypothetical protein
MGTLSSTVQLNSSDFLSDTLSINQSFDITGTHSEGIARKKVTSIAKATGSGQVVLYTASTYTAGAVLYIKNTSTSASEYLHVYVDTATDDPDLLRLAGGQVALLPLSGGSTLSAYATSTLIVEFGVFGTEA